VIFVLVVVPIDASSAPSCLQIWRIAVDELGARYGKSLEKINSIATHELEAVLKSFSPPVNDQWVNVDTNIQLGRPLVAQDGSTSDVSLDIRLVRRQQI